MGAARSWAVMAVAGPTLSASLFLAMSGPGRHFLFDVVHCAWGIGTGLQSLVALGVGVVALAIALTFATDALRRQSLSVPARVLWSLGLLFGGVLTMPLYWALYLRERERPEL